LTALIGRFYRALMFRLNWRRVDARLVDSRTVVRNTTGSASAHPHEAIVAFAGVDGREVRLKVWAPIVVALPGKGGVVPLRVKPDDSKAVVDKRDSRINVNALAKARRTAEKERFDAQLRKSKP